MADLFSPYTLKGVTLRNRIAMSPMTMYRSVDGKMNDYHVMLLGSRAAGGFGLVFPEQIAIVPEGRTSTGCGGIYDEAQLDGLARVTAIVKAMGGVSGDPARPYRPQGQRGEAAGSAANNLPPDHPDGWQLRRPLADPLWRRRYIYPVHELTGRRSRTSTRPTRSPPGARRRRLKWLEMHFAHGYLGASFFSPIANQRTDNMAEASKTASASISRRSTRSARSGPNISADDAARLRRPQPQGHPVRRMPSSRSADEGPRPRSRRSSLGFNTDEMTKPPFNDVGFMVERANRVRREVGIPVAASWNLGVPQNADQVIRAGTGRPRVPRPPGAVQSALADLGGARTRPCRPVLTGARRLGLWLRNFRAHHPASAGREIPEPAAEPERKVA